MNSEINRHELRYCDYCHKELLGRSDKRYCNDTCRNNGNRQYRKKMAWEEPIFIRQINNILRRNHRILSNLMENADGPKPVSRQQLIAMGFSFRFQTTMLSTKGGDYYFSYDYGWKSLDEEKVLVVANPNQAMI